MKKWSRVLFRSCKYYKQYQYITYNINTAHNRAQRDANIVLNHIFHTFELLRLNYNDIIF